MIEAQVRRHPLWLRIAEVAALCGDIMLRRFARPIILSINSLIPKACPSCTSKIRRGSESLLALLRLRPHPCLSSVAKLDVNDVRPTADGTVLDILLGSACRCIDWYHDFFATGIAHIARIASHVGDSTNTMAGA